MKVEVKKISLENYKKFQSKSVDLFPRTEISGRNREGKSTLQDAYLDVLTGKMANGTEPTSIRRKENGVEVEGDIVREIEAVINGKKIALKKVTKKGKNSSSTSYFLNGGVKLSKAEFNDFLKEEIASPETIAMCSNPSFFLNMLRKSTSDARETLTRICKFDMEEFINSNPSFKIAKEIIEDKSVKNKSPEEAVKALRSDLKEKKVESNKVSDDISKLSKKEDEHADTSSLESKKQELNTELSKLEEQEQILEDSAKGYDSLAYEIRGLKSSKDGLVSKADKELKDKKAAIMNVYYDLAKKKIEKESDIRILGIELDSHIRAGQQAKADLDRARQDYPRIKEMEWDDSELKAIEAETLNASDTICPTCGQELPDEQIAELRASFEEKKKARIEAQLKVKESFELEKQEKLKYVCDLGNTSVAKLKKTNEEINKLQSEISAAQDEVSELTKQIKEEQSKFTELPESVDMTNDEEYLAVTARIAELEEKLKSFDDVPGKKQELRIQISNVMKQISNVDADIKIAQAAVIEKEKRVDELNEELKSLGQVQADIEQQIDTVLNFSIQKNKALAEKINPYFKHFQFSFLDYTIEGNPVETCKMICNGVNYFDGLNYSDKILCDIDLLRGLQALNGLNLPIFVDNSESINTTRLPNTEQQMLVLRVTDGDLTAKEL